MVLRVQCIDKTIKNGNLLFYTNGCAVMDRNLNLMPNGDSINSGQMV